MKCAWEKSDFKETKFTKSKRSQEERTEGTVLSVVATPGSPVRLSPYLFPPTPPPPSLLRHRCLWPCNFNKVESPWHEFSLVRIRSIIWHSCTVMYSEIGSVAATHSGTRPTSSRLCLVKVTHWTWNPGVHVRNFAATLGGHANSHPGGEAGGALLGGRSADMTPLRYAATQSRCDSWS